MKHMNTNVDVISSGTSGIPLATGRGRGELDWRLGFPKGLVVQLRRALTDHTSEV